MKDKNRRSWGMWRLYTSEPISLGIKPYRGTSVYHICLDTCATPESREIWLKHIDGKWGIPSTRHDLERAFNELLQEGLIQNKEES